MRVSRVLGTQEREESNFRRQDRHVAAQEGYVCWYDDNQGVKLEFHIQQMADVELSSSYGHLSS